MKNFLLVFFVSILLISCEGLFGKAEISDDCTVNGNGRVSCSFLNEGNAKGSICVQPYLQRVSYLEKNSFEYGFYGEGGTEAKTNGKMCSGIVEAGDVVERQKSMSFSSGIYSDIDTSDFCTKAYNDYGSWYDGCNFGTRVID